MSNKKRMNSAIQDDKVTKKPKYDSYDTTYQSIILQQQVNDLSQKIDKMNNILLQQQVENLSQKIDQMEKNNTHLLRKLERLENINSSLLKKLNNLDDSSQRSDYSYHMDYIS